MWEYKHHKGMDVEGAGRRPFGILIRRMNGVAYRICMQREAKRVLEPANGRTDGSRLHDHMAELTLRWSLSGELRLRTAGIRGWDRVTWISSMQNPPGG